MLSAPRVCRQSGCGQPAERDGNGFCKLHQQVNEQKQRDRVRRQDEINRLYCTSLWDGFRRTMLAQNPLCQRIINGMQCLNAARIVHHLISPRVDRSRFVDPTAVACLCAHHHPDDAGTPWWKPGVDYVATQFTLPSF